MKWLGKSESDFLWMSLEVFDDGLKKLRCISGHYRTLASVHAHDIDLAAGKIISPFAKVR